MMVGMDAYKRIRRAVLKVAEKYGVIEGYFVWFKGWGI